MKKIKGIKLTPKVEKRLKDAEEDYQKLLREIMPFVKEKKSKPHPTYGKWTSSRIEGA
jgi:hypothetical protein